MQRIQTGHAQLVFGLLLATFLVLFGSSRVLAQDDKTHDTDEESVRVIQENLETKKKKIDELKSKIAQYEQSIRSRQNEAASLSNQIGILSSNIEKTKLDIELTQNEMDKTNTEIQETELEIESAKEAIAKKKELLARYVRMLYRMDHESVVEVLLKNSTLSDYFIQVGVIERIQNKLKESKKNIDEEKILLEKKNLTLSDKRLSLVKYSQDLATKQDTLERNMAVRTRILTETKSSETKFRIALQDLKEEQNDINSDIVSLEKQIREKVQQGGLEKLRQLGNVAFGWPVPNSGITAFFHDQDYPFRYVFEHPAVDIRSPQGTAVRAAASGFVGRAKQGGRTARGYGYSYIMLIHNDGFSTVYGHVSKILVEEDQFVNQGDIIALSGGRPGTPGSGPLTTGPHLHFEVRVNGIPADPLDYLP